MLSKHILTAKSMIINNLKIQMLAGNSLEMCIGIGFEITSTLVTDRVPEIEIRFSGTQNQLLFLFFAKILACLMIFQSFSVPLFSKYVKTLSK